MAVGVRRKGAKARINASIRPETLYRFETLTLDRAYQRPVYGFRSQIIDDLISQWCDAREAEIASKVPSNPGAQT